MCFKLKTTLRPGNDSIKVINYFKTGQVLKIILKPLEL